LTDNPESDNEFVQVTVSGLAIDPQSNAPVVILSPEETDDILPIWIGHYEAWAIAMELQEVPSKRPMTHDLLRSLLEDLGGKLEKVSVTDMRDQTFYAEIEVKQDGKTVKIDARPSDSIALALKCHAPIYVNSKLFKLKATGDKTDQKQYDPEELKQRLKNINPEDFGKYSL